MMTEGYDYKGILYRFYDKMKQFVSSIYMKSFVIAIFYWMIIYVIVGTSFIIIKWNSTDQTIISMSSSTNDELLMLNTNDQHELIQKYINTIQHEIHIKHQEIDHIHQQQKSINDAIQSFRTIQNRLVSLNNNNNEEEEKKIVEDSEEEVDKNSNNKIIQPKTLKLKQLLSIIESKALHELRSSNQFTKYINSATNEIQLNIEHIMSSLSLYYKNNYNDPNIMFPIVNWPIYTELLHNNENNKKTEKSKHNDDDDDDSMFGDGGGCANPYLTTSSSTSNSIYVTIDDMEHKMETMKSTLLLPFRNNNNDTESALTKLPFLSFDMIKESEQLIHDAIGQYRMLMKQNHNVIVDQSYEEGSIIINDKNNEGSGSCLLHINDVDSWIDAGLDAMYRQKDIGNAIMNVIHQQNIPFDIESYYRQYPNNNNDNKHVNGKMNAMKTNTNKQIQWMTEIKNIRQLIDIPMIHILISYLDIIIDKMSGQNDIIDDILEKYIWSQIPDNQLDDHDIIAKTFIKTIFPLVGQYNITIPKPIIN